MDDIQQWYMSLPVVTKVWLTAALAVNVAATMDLVEHPRAQLTFDVGKIVQNMELYRCVTCFLYCGDNLNQFHALITIYMMYVHSYQYESNPYNTSSKSWRRSRHRKRSNHPTSDYLFCLIVCMIVILVSYVLINFGYDTYYDSSGDGRRRRHHYGQLLYPLFTRSLVMSVMYVWSKRNPTQMINLNFVPLQGQYLPFAHVALSYALGNRNVNEMIHGIFVGHIYYYLVVVVPSVTGKNVLTTPRVLIDLIEGHTGDDDEDGDGDDDELDIDINDLVNDDVRQQVNVNRAQLLRRFQQMDGATPAHVAAKINDLTTLRALARNSDTKQYFVQRDNNGWQPLHEAVRGGYMDIINFLLVDSQQQQSTSEDSEENDDDDDDDEQQRQQDNTGRSDATTGNDVAIVVDINARTNYRQRNDNLGSSPLYLSETIHGVQHPVSIRLRELGAIRFAPGERSCGGDDE